VRLDHGPVHLGTAEGCAVRVPAFGVGTARLVVRPLIGSEAEGRADAAGQPLVGPHYEVLDTSEVPCLLVNGSPTRRKVLDDGDLLELFDLRTLSLLADWNARRTAFGLRYLRRGRGAWAQPTPPPLGLGWQTPDGPVVRLGKRRLGVWTRPSGVRGHGVRLNACSRPPNAVVSTPERGGLAPQTLWSRPLVARFEAPRRGLREGRSSCPDPLNHALSRAQRVAPDP
jgi:hypothetical protein